MEYVTLLRLKKVRELYQMTGSSMAELAMESGFQNVSNFYRMYKKYIGELPDRICWSVGILVPVLLYAAVYFSKNSVASYQVLCTDVTILALGMLVADLLYTDYSALGILTITFMYAFRKIHVKRVLVGCIALTVFNSIEITSFFTLIPVKKYNGERGLSMKYFFYAFYPVHLFLLYLISRYVV